MSFSEISLWGYHCWPHPCQEGHITDQSFWLAHQVYSEECDEPRGKGSFPAMITPAYQNAKKANELVSDVSAGRATEVWIMGCWQPHLLNAKHRHTSPRAKQKQTSRPASGPNADSLIDLFIDFDCVICLHGNAVGQSLLLT
jgi:hypothetical protein